LKDFNIQLDTTLIPKSSIKIIFWEVLKLIKLYKRLDMRLLREKIITLV